MSRRAHRLALALAWASVVVAWILYQRSTGDSTTETAQRFIDNARGAWWAFAAFVLIYAARPLVLFPASVLTIGGGILFGPVVGVVATVVGANVSAMVAYGVARWFSSSSDGQDDDETEARWSLLERWSERMRNDSFITVMVMRLLFLPYDLVNYAAGFLRIRPLPFLLATAIGSLPGTISFTLAGASLDRIDEGLSGIDLRVFGISVVLFVVSIGVARWLRSREDMAEADVVEPVGAGRPA